MIGVGRVFRQTLGVLIVQFGEWFYISWLDIDSTWWENKRKGRLRVTEIRAWSRRCKIWEMVGVRLCNTH